MRAVTCYIADRIAEMMQAAPAFDGILQPALCTIGRNKFQVTRVPRKLKKLNVCGLRRIMNHRRAGSIAISADINISRA